LNRIYITIPNFFDEKRRQAIPFIQMCGMEEEKVQLAFKGRHIPINFLGGENPRKIFGV
tara:strand:+ start:1169 stop:1345 length:177 start_codon:yes stop_codon:yes gene_type:complete